MNARERKNELARERYANDPAYRERKNMLERKRIQEPACRKRKNELAREHYHQKKDQKS
jgi:hypothetical protein